jgi:uncharacterized membrane protein
MLQALSKINYKFDIIIITIILAISIIEQIHTDMIFYNAGLVNGIGFKAIPYGLLYEILKIVIVLFAVTRIFFHLKPDKRNKKYAVTALVSVLIFIGSWVFMFTVDQPGAVYYLRGFKEWVTKNVDVDAVQAWILSEEADKYLKNKPSAYFKDDFPGDLPDFITNFGPEYIAFYEDNSENERCVKLTWLHGISEYKGIVIGSPAMKTKQEELIKHSNYDFEYRRSIKSGVYVVHGR